MDETYLNGIWEGFYTYGPEYPIEYLSIKENFTLELVVKEGIVTGICTDSYVEKYFEEPATLEGTLIGNVLSLVKRYPYYMATGENDEIILDKTSPSHEIHYIGYIKRKWFSRKYFIQGTWDISGSVRDEEGNALYYSYDGEWEIRRVG